MDINHKLEQILPTKEAWDPKTKKYALKPNPIYEELVQDYRTPHEGTIVVKMGHAWSGYENGYCRVPTYNALFYVRFGENWYQLSAYPNL